MKAWKTTACDIESIVFAETRGKAHAVTLRAANDAGYRIKWSDVRVLREPELDVHAKRNSVNTALRRERVVK